MLSSGCSAVEVNLNIDTVSNLNITSSTTAQKLAEALSISSQSSSSEQRPIPKPVAIVPKPVLTPTNTFEAEPNFHPAPIFESGNIDRVPSSNSHPIPYPRIPAPFFYDHAQGDSSLEDLALVVKGMRRDLDLERRLRHEASSLAAVNAESLRRLQRSVIHKNYGTSHWCSPK